MGKNTTRNLGLSALVGLFAIYGFTANNLRVDSVSSSGLVIKYSKRGIASTIKCPPINQEIDRITADSLSSEECRHHVSSTTLENGDIEYTVTSYYRGHISTASNVFKPSEIASNADLYKDFIVGVVRTSKAKFDATPAAQEVARVELASATQTEEESTEEVPAVDEEVATEAIEESVEEPTVVAANANGQPTVTPPSSYNSSNDSDEDPADDEESGDADALMDALEKYSELKAAYNSCQTNSSENKDIKSIIRKYDAAVTDYARDLMRFEASGNADDDEAKTPFEKLSDRNKEKLNDFISNIDEVGSSSSDAASADQLTCLLERSKEMPDRESQFNHYVQNIQPLLRAEMQTDSQERFNEVTRALNDSSSPITELARNNPLIAGSVRADYSGAKANLLHAGINERRAEAEKLSEPQRGYQLQALQRDADQIDSDLRLSLSQIKASNPILEGHLANGAQFWTQQNRPFQMIQTAASVSSAQTLQSQVGSDAAATNPNELLEKMFERIAATANGTGNARKQVVPQGIRRSVVPQLNQRVEAPGAIQ
jgi:hypothetical protein